MSLKKKNLKRKRRNKNSPNHDESETPIRRSPLSPPSKRMFHTVEADIHQNMNNDQNDFDDIDVVGTAVGNNKGAYKSKTDGPIPQNVEEFGMELDILSDEDLVNDDLLDKDKNASNTKYCTPKNSTKIHSIDIVNCDICDEIVSNEHQALNCDICDEWLHIICVDVNEKEYSLIEKLKDKIKWFCPSCDRG